MTPVKTKNWASDEKSPGKVISVSLTSDLLKISIPQGAAGNLKG